MCVEKRASALEKKIQKESKRKTIRVIFQHSFVEEKSESAQIFLWLLQINKKNVTFIHNHIEKFLNKETFKNVHLSCD